MGDPICKNRRKKGLGDEVPGDCTGQPEMEEVMLIVTLLQSLLSTIALNTRCQLVLTRNCGKIWHLLFPGQH